MLAALTAFFTALANAANAYAKRLDGLAMTKKWEYEDEADKLQNEIVQLRNIGSPDSCARADALVLRVETLSSRIKRLSDANVEPCGRDNDSD